MQIRPQDMLRSWVEWREKQVPMEWKIENGKGMMLMMCVCVFFSSAHSPPPSPYTPLAFLFYFSLSLYYVLLFGSFMPPSSPLWTYSSPSFLRSPFHHGRAPPGKSYTVMPLDYNEFSKSSQFSFSSKSIPIKNKNNTKSLHHTKLIRTKSCLIHTTPSSSRPCVR